MKTKAGRRSIPMLLLPVLAAAAFLAPSGRAVCPSGPAAPPPTDLVGYICPPKSAHPKIDSALWNTDRAGGGPGGGVSSAGLTRVVIEMSGRGGTLPPPRETRRVGRQVEALGGTVERTSGRLVQALLPVGSLESLASLPDVARVRLPLRPRPATVVSEGVARSGAYSWFALPSYRPAANPVRVAVLDTGFAGYAGLLGGELPADIVVRSFRADGDIEAGTAHGTACAEIVRDMAPEARIYLVNFETDVELHAAVEYLIAEEVHVVSCSLVWPEGGAGDGTGPVCEDVAKCAARDIVWVNAAGDDGRSHWSGAFADSDGDSFQNFSAGDEILQWSVPAGTETEAVLSWDDWGDWDGTSYPAPTRDFDLVLWRWTGTAWKFLEYCDDWQTGVPGQKPVERTSLWKTEAAAVYGVSILRWSAPGTDTLRLVVQGNGGNIEYLVPGGSLAVPADAAGAVAVGATDAETDVLQPWSSRGPTADGRRKPDFTAFSGVSTAALGSRAFSGTSAAAPHVAGAFGLLLAKTPYTPGQVLTILQNRARDFGDPGPDNLFGHGRLSLYKKTAP